jgi:pimeloyl-ACP methyl ester carboxylesterase
MKSKSIKRMFVVLLTTVLAFILIIACTVLIDSPGKIKPFLDDSGKPVPGSISEKTFIDIGGVRQGMFIRSKNTNNPVLLYVHGGPAFPNYFLFDQYKPGLEDYFTVCYWEQRGGGLSYAAEVSPESMTFNQLALDAVEVTNYLRDRFGKDKIYLMAHSGGTPIALLAASRNPELYHAYIGMGQITNQTESEKMAYIYMLDKYAAAGNQKNIQKLSKYRVLEADSNVVSFYKSAIRDQAMHALGIGTMHQMHSVFWGVFVPVWTCKAYTFREKINIWTSKFSFLPKTSLIHELLETDFTVEVPKLDTPVYFFSGKYDLTVNVNLAKAYLDKLQAPLKGFYTFDNSAHSPLFEESARVRQIIENDILKDTCSLADKTL